MKIIRFIHLRLLAIFTIVCCMSLSGYAQNVETAPAGENPEEEEMNVIDRIMDESEGNVEIIIDDSLIEKILKMPVSHKRNRNSGPAIRKGVNKLSGFRIQVFGDGRNQHSLESRARARGVAITARYPKYRGQVYTFSKSPNWFTHVGNFRTAAEANAALAELKASFPQFANEMRVVKSQIVIIKQ